MDTDMVWHDVLRRYSSDVDVPDEQVAGVLSGLESGMRRRDRRTAGRRAGLAVAASVLALGLAAGYLATGRPSGGQPAQVSGSPSARAATSAPQMLADLTGALTGGQVSGQVSGPHSEALNTGGLYVWVSFDDGHGAVAIAAMLEPSPTIDPNICASPTFCRSRQLDDGSRLLSVRQDAASAGWHQWWVALTRPDGTTITVLESNTIAPKGDVVARPLPPLSLDALEAIVITLNWYAR